MERPVALRPPRAVLWLSVVICVMVGCGGERQAAAPPSPPAGPTPSVTLRVLVVNDPPLAEALGRLRGEWSARSGGQLEATSKPWAEVASAEASDADVVIFPARYLGTLCERGWLRPVRDSVVQGKTYDADDVLPLVRQKLIRYGGKEMALPLSVEMPLVGYRQGWLAERHGEAPRSWDAYRELVGRGDYPFWWPGAASVDHWDAMGLLARAAAYAVHPNREGVLFDPRTMHPRIADPPFVRALEAWRGEVVASASPDDNASSADTDEPDGAEPMVWAELPGSVQVYNHMTGQWDSAEGGVWQVPLVGGGGELAGVTTASRNAASAFRLLAWLTGPDIGGQIGPKASASLPCRRSQLRAIGRWFHGPGGRADPGQVARAVERALGGEACLVVPPLPGIDEYLAALDREVKLALRGEVPAEDALDEVALRWDQITDAHGREAQHRAYLDHLGIVEP